MLTYLYFNSSRKTQAFNAAQQQSFIISPQILVLKFKATKCNCFSSHDSVLKQLSKHLPGNN